MPLYPKLRTYSEQREEELSRIPNARRRILDALAEYVREPSSREQSVRLNFICTHNSRRSQISQAWARAAAVYYSIEEVETYSGGTEATAFNRRAVEALRRAGFGIDGGFEQKNPVYRVRLDDNEPPLAAFSKVYDQTPNPRGGFCAVMNCSSADANCPVVPGATMRIALPYDDPGDADGTAGEEKAYDRCCRRISRELLYVFSRARG